MSSAERLKRVFRIDIETCRDSGGPVLDISDIQMTTSEFDECLQLWPNLVEQLIDRQRIATRNASRL
jgi:hypothetical protein